jgi:hypothetical protein
LEAGGWWKTGDSSSGKEELRRARYIIAGLAAETVCKLDKPGSSLDEQAMSQFVGINAAAKLADSKLTDDVAFREYVHNLWQEQVWSVAGKILCANVEPANQLAALLHQHERVHGRAIRKVLAQVKGITS